MMEKRKTKKDELKADMISVDLIGSNEDIQAATRGNPEVPLNDVSVSTVISFASIINPPTTHIWLLNNGP